MASLPPYTEAIGCYPLKPVLRGRGSHLKRIQVPFRLSNCKEIKQDLGSFTTDSDQYIQAFIPIIQTSELAWKDFMLLLDQTLTSLLQQRVLDQDSQVGNDYHLQKSSVKPTPLEGEAEDPGVLTGAQEVPRMDPRCDPRSEVDECARHHFIHLTTEDLKRARVRPLNYSQVTPVQQGPNDSPMVFLQCLKDAITKHTTVESELQVRIH
jgi:hypothetical protein